MSRLRSVRDAALRTDRYMVGATLHFGSSVDPNTQRLVLVDVASLRQLEVRASFVAAFCEGMACAENARQLKIHNMEVWANGGEASL